MVPNKIQYVPMELTDTFDLIGLASAVVGNGKPTGRKYQWSSPFVPYNDNTNTQIELGVEDYPFLGLHWWDNVDVDLTFFPKDQEGMKKALSGIASQYELKDPSDEHALAVVYTFLPRKDVINSFGYRHFKDGNLIVSSFPPKERYKPSIKTQDDVKEILHDVLGGNVNFPEFAHDLLNKSRYRVSEYSKSENITDKEKRMFAIHREIAKKRLLKVRD